MSVATVFWEDQLAANATPKSFGPHRLLLACVGDEVGRSSYELDRVVRSIALKGVTKVIARASKDAQDLQDLCIVVDRDRIHETLALPPNARCRSRTSRALRDRIGSAADYRIVLLQQNMESLVLAAANVLERDAPAKARDARDNMLHDLASRTDRTLRDRVRARIDGLDRAVEWTQHRIAGWF
jgi:hypothetical protein